MNYTYPLPTARAWDDFEQYIPLLLAAVDAELLRESAWDETELTDALLYMDDLKTYLADLPTRLMQTGTITLYPLATLPNRYLACNGQAVSRSEYAALFGVVGIFFGAGDGTGTFNVPNLTASSGLQYVIFAG